jgi:hypothetical protein
VLADRLFALRNHPQSGFANQTHESVASLLSFGFQGMTVDKLIDERRRPCRARLPQRAYRPALRPRGSQRHDRDDAPQVQPDHRQALMKWGERPRARRGKAAEDVTGKKLEDSACYIHRISPNRRL